MKENGELLTALIKREPGFLDRPVEELVKMRTVGEAYITAHAALVKGIKEAKLASADLEARLADGQAIGEAVLDIKVKIGKLAGGGTGKKRRLEGALPSSKDLGLGSDNERKRYMTLAAHPEAIEVIKAEARETQDIPTEVAVRNRVKAVLADERAERYKAKVKALKTQATRTTTGDALIYLSKLREIVLLLPEKAPQEGWSDSSFAEAQAMVALIRKRLEVWG